MNEIDYYEKFLNEDLPKGKAAELKYGQMIADAKNMDFIYEDGGKGYDFLINGMKIECKLQDEARTNVFLEFKCRGQSSGLSTTTAAWWFICLPQEPHREVLIFRPKDAQGYCRANQVMVRTGGDDMQSIGYSVRINNLKKAIQTKTFKI